MNSLRNFVLGISATFFVPWLCLIVIPHAIMKAESVEWKDEEIGKEYVYPPGKPNIFLQGQTVYAQEGCAVCHTQMIRPTYLGFESWRPDFGKEGTVDVPVRVRETRSGDYAGERFAYLGVQRIGPDLSNVGYRHDEAWHHEHLYAPKSKRKFSIMPSFRHLYDKRKVRGQGSESALKNIEWKNEEESNEYEVVPTESARALVGYLMTLKKDAPFSASEGNSPEQDAGDGKKK